MSHVTMRCSETAKYPKITPYTPCIQLQKKKSYKGDSFEAKTVFWKRAAPSSKNSFPILNEKDQIYFSSKMLQSWSFQLDSIQLSLIEFFDATSSNRGMTDCVVLLATRELYRRFYHERRRGDALLQRKFFPFILGFFFI